MSSAAPRGHDLAVLPTTPNNWARRRARKAGSRRPPRPGSARSWYTREVTREELVTKLEVLRDEATAVDTDAAAVLACLARVLGAGDDASGLTDWCLEAERRLAERRERRGR